MARASERLKSERVRCSCLPELHVELFHYALLREQHLNRDYPVFSIQGPSRCKHQDWQAGHLSDVAPPRSEGAHRQLDCAGGTTVVID